MERRTLLVTAVLGAVAAVAAGTLLVVRDRGGDAPPGRPGPPTVRAAGADDLLVRRCLDRAHNGSAGESPPYDEAPFGATIRLRHTDRSGTVLLVETGAWVGTCDADPTGTLRNYSADGARNLAPDYFTPAPGAAPIQRQSQTVSPRDEGFTDFAVLGRIGAEVRRISVLCPGAAPADATIAGSLFYGRVQVPTDRAPATNRCAVEAYDADGRPLGRDEPFG